MADVFLSYSRKDRAKLEPIASALGELGVTVWYDARLQSGASFDEVIARELDAATVVIACWSAEAIASKWTRSEALFALDQQKLAAVFLESCKLSPPFNLIHADDLTDWQGQAGHHGFAQLIERVAAALKRPGLVEMNGALAAGDSALYDWARRHPDEPKAKEIWRAARARHEAEFVKETEAVHAEIEHLAKLRREAALARLSSCRDSFVSWIEAERTGTATARPDPRASLQALFGSEEGEAAKKEAAALSRQFVDARLRIAELDKKSELEGAKATQALSLLDAANREIAQRSTHIDKLRSETTQQRKRADTALSELEAARAEARAAEERFQRLQGERDRLASKDTDLAQANLKLQELRGSLAKTEEERDALTRRLASPEGESPSEEAAKPFYEGRYAALLGVVVIAVLWFAAIALGIAPFQGPSVAVEIIWGATLRSLLDLGIGVAIGSLTAAGAIVLLRRVRPTRTLLIPVLRALAPLPLIAPLPLFMVWFGVVVTPIAAVGFASCLVLLTMAERSANGPWRDMQRSVANPHAGLAPIMRRLVALALLVTIASEMAVGDAGLGANMEQSASEFATTNLTAMTIILAVMAFALDRAAIWIGGRLARRR